MDAEKIKLTPIQKRVVSCLQGGGILLTDNEHKGAEVAYADNSHFHIDNGIFWRLVHKGIIGQSLSYPFHYGLTSIGLKIKTKNEKK